MKPSELYAIYNQSDNEITGVFTSRKTAEIACKRRKALFVRCITYVLNDKELANLKSSADYFYKVLTFQQAMDDMKEREAETHRHDGP